MRLVGYEERFNWILMSKLEGKRPLERYSHRRKVILEWFFQKYDEMLWTGLV